MNNININQVIKNMLPNLPGNNPMAQNLIKMINNNDQNGIKEMAENILKTNGITYEQAQKEIITRLFNR